MENHHFQWVNPLFLWPFSIAMLVITRGYGLSVLFSLWLSPTWQAMRWEEVRGLGWPGSACDFFPRKIVFFSSAKGSETRNLWWENSNCSTFVCCFSLIYGPAKKRWFEQLQFSSRWNLPIDADFTSQFMGLVLLILVRCDFRMKIRY